MKLTANLVRMLIVKLSTLGYHVGTVRIKTTDLPEALVWRAEIILGSEKTLTVDSDKTQSQCTLYGFNLTPDKDKELSYTVQIPVDGI